MSSSSTSSSAGMMTERCSDDGEPTGTAGVPILSAIRAEGLSETLCVVVRYYGGIKLGSGGLIRAYGSAARNVLRSADVVVRMPRVELRVSTNVSNSGSIYSIVSRHAGTTTSNEAYDDGGTMMEVTIACDEDISGCVD